MCVPLLVRLCSLLLGTGEFLCTTQERRWGVWLSIARAYYMYNAVNYIYIMCVVFFP